MTHPANREDRELRGRLAALRTDLPDADFKASLHQRLVAAGPPASPSPWLRLVEAMGGRRMLWPLVGSTSGVAAGVAAFLLLASPSTPPGVADPARLATVLPATHVAVVRLRLTADGPVDAAQIRVTLPAGLSFWSDGRELAQRDFEWTQPLTAGDNEIPIAVRGQRPGRYRIGVDTRVGGQRIDDEIVIEVTGG
jgi:hypothetical protein